MGFSRHGSRAVVQLSLGMQKLLDVILETDWRLAAMKVIAGMLMVEVMRLLFDLRSGSKWSQQTVFIGSFIGDVFMSLALHYVTSPLRRLQRLGWLTSRLLPVYTLSEAFQWYLDQPPDVLWHAIERLIVVCSIMGAVCITGWGVKRARKSRGRVARVRSTGRWGNRQQKT